MYGLPLRSAETTASWIAACTIASSYVGCTVAGCTPGVDWSVSRKRFQSSTGRALCVLCARGCTRNVYLFSAIRA